MRSREANFTLGSFSDASVAALQPQVTLVVADPAVLVGARTLPCVTFDRTVKMSVKLATPQNLVRVANDITRAFEHACADGDFEIAASLLRTLEKMLPSDRTAFRDRRVILERLVSSHATLWSLKNSHAAAGLGTAGLGGASTQAPVSLH
jgi:hypothetical protein